MRCVVTAGPTYEPFDRVRRLTNFSTGRLGSALALHLAGAGHEVILLRGEMAVHRSATPSNCRTVEFSTAKDLARNLELLATDSIAAVFHAAAVSDFEFGKISTQNASGEWVETVAGKVSSDTIIVRAELHPVPKILRQLRGWFPASLIVGWKYEVDGDRASALELGWRQIEVNSTDACVVNGPAYGGGYGLLQRNKPPLFLADAEVLCSILARRLPA